MKKNPTLFVEKKFKTQFRFSNLYMTRENIPMPCLPVQASPTSSEKFPGRIKHEVQAVFPTLGCTAGNQIALDTTVLRCLLYLLLRQQR